MPKNSPQVDLEALEVLIESLTSDQLEQLAARGLVEVRRAKREYKAIAPRPQSRHLKPVIAEDIGEPGRTKPVTAKLEPETIAALDALAGKGVPTARSAKIRQAIREYIKRHG